MHGHRFVRKTDEYFMQLEDEKEKETKIKIKCPEAVAGNFSKIRRVRILSPRETSMRWEHMGTRRLTLECDIVC